jgi:hypothetical protein
MWSCAFQRYFLTRSSAIHTAEYNIMAPPPPPAPAARDDREGLSPSPQPFGLADAWEDDGDDIEYQPGSEQSEDRSQDDTEGDGESDYMSRPALSHQFAVRQADLK